MRTMGLADARDILRREDEGGHIQVVDKPACVGGKNAVLVNYRISDGRIFTLRRTSKVPYYAVKYFFEVYMPMEVRV